MSTLLLRKQALPFCTSRPSSAGSMLKISLLHEDERTLRNFPGQLNTFPESITKKRKCVLRLRPSQPRQTCKTEMTTACVQRNPGIGSSYRLIPNTDQETHGLTDSQQANRFLFHTHVLTSATKSQSHT